MIRDTMLDTSAHVIRLNTIAWPSRNMQHITLEELADLLGHMTIIQPIDSGSAVVHQGHVPTLAISSCRAGNGYIIQ
jgi:hypothetical protein